MMHVLEGEALALQGGGCQTHAFFCLVYMMNDMPMQALGMAGIAPCLIGVNGSTRRSLSGLLLDYIQSINLIMTRYMI